MLLKYWLDTTNFALTSNSQHYRHNQRPKEHWEKANEKKKSQINYTTHRVFMLLASRYFLPYYTLKFKSASHCLCAAFAIHVQLMRTSLFLSLSGQVSIHIQCQYKVHTFFCGIFNSSPTAKYITIYDILFFFGSFFSLHCYVFLWSGSGNIGKIPTHCSPDWR